ncbi:MAG: glutaredoxin family protein [Cellvibrionaceae bacterium]
MKKLILYSTLGCHLCELALDEIQPCLDNTEWRLEEVDIADDPELLKLYGTSIPVLSVASVNKQLYWPFDQQGVSDFLNGE